MPWLESSVKDQKLLFVADSLRGEESMTVLCEHYGISRQTGYELKRRFLAEGPLGLEERSRAPLEHGRATPADVVVRLIEARKQRPHWGPKKLLAKLGRDDPGIAWPSASTVSASSRTDMSFFGLPMLKMRPSAQPSLFSMMRMSASTPSSM